MMLQTDRNGRAPAFRDQDKKDVHKFLSRAKGMKALDPTQAIAWVGGLEGNANFGEHHNTRPSM